MVKYGETFKVLPCVFVLEFFSPFSILITSLGEERAGLCASNAFVSFARVGLCLFFFFFGLGIGCDL